jgi:dynein intermediate chain 1, axonemal
VQMSMGCDVQWLPSVCQVHVFDLAENKDKPLCEQRVVRKARLTKLAFNPHHPVLLVGDDR